MLYEYKLNDFNCLLINVYYRRYDQKLELGGI